MSSICFAQNIFLSEVKEINTNDDKFLYALKHQPENVQYLGKIEINGFSNNDEKIFSEIYQKAKSIGGNTYFLKPIENIEGDLVFNPNHYIILIYYIEKTKIPNQENTIYIINSNSEKEIKLKINSNKLKLPSRSFIQYNISKDKITDISVGKLLGSRIKLQSKTNQSEQFFMVLGKKLTTNPPNSPGINFKTGDIIKIEKSFALFLTNIYSEIK